MSKIILGICTCTCLVLVNAREFISITTRYYDCCKPSCAWGDKARVTRPVRTCFKNGSRILNTNTISGCESGEAFMCNTGTPIKVNENVSYGFAAANIKFEKEEDWCCACYELTFLNGKIKGKKLVVQVTNTGYDLKNNHFDLEIPGGGQGIFKGCTKKYGRYFGGKVYGGITKREECLGLPKGLRSGCFWRFDWFKNANNPDVMAKRVGCPKELVRLSECERVEKA
jgi:hypothetical protein